MKDKMKDMWDGRSLLNGRNLLSVFAPVSLGDPMILVSTIFGDSNQERSTAIRFGYACNRVHLMKKVFTPKECYESEEWEDLMKEIGEFIVIKKHKIWEEAYQYHIELMGNMNRNSYSLLYDKYCSKQLKEWKK